MSRPCAAQANACGGRVRHGRRSRFGASGRVAEFAIGADCLRGGDDSMREQRQHRFRHDGQPRHRVCRCVRQGGSDRVGGRQRRGSGQGVAALINNSCEIANCSRKFEKKEIADCDAKQPGKEPKDSRAYRRTIRVSSSSRSRLGYHSLIFFRSSSNAANSRCTLPCFLVR